MKKIVKGNDFTLRIPVSRMFNGVAEPFPLPGCTDIVVNVVSSYRRISLPYAIDVSDDHIINARVEGDAIPRGIYALEVKGKFLGNDWRSNEYEQFSIVDNNASGDTAFTPQEGEDSVLMNTALIILAPDVALGGLIADAEKAIAKVDEKLTEVDSTVGEAVRKADAATEQATTAAATAAKSANDAATAANTAKTNAETATKKATDAAGAATTATANANTATQKANDAATASEKVNATITAENVLEVTDRTGAKKTLALADQTATAEKLAALEKTDEQQNNRLGKLEQAVTDLGGTSDAYYYASQDTSQPSPDLVNPQTNASIQLLQDMYRPFLVDHTEAKAGVEVMPADELKRNNWLRYANGKFAPAVGITEEMRAECDVELYLDAEHTEKYCDAGKFDAERFYNQYGMTQKLYDAQGKAVRILRPWETTSKDYSIMVGDPSGTYLLDGYSTKEGEQDIMYKGISKSYREVAGCKPRYLAPTLLAPCHATSVTGSDGKVRFRSFPFLYNAGDDNTKGGFNADFGVKMFYDNGCYPRVNDVSQITSMQYARNNNADQTKSYPFAEAGFHAYNTFIIAHELLYGTNYIDNPDTLFSFGVSDMNNCTNNATWEKYGGIRVKAGNDGEWSYKTWSHIPSFMYKDATGTKVNANFSVIFNYDFPKWREMEAQLVLSFATELGVQENTEFDVYGQKYRYITPSKAKGLTDGYMNAIVYKVVPAEWQGYDANGNAVTWKMEANLPQGIIDGLTTSGDIFCYAGGGYEQVAIYHSPTSAGKAGAEERIIYIETDQRKWHSETVDRKNDNVMFDFESQYEKVEHVDNVLSRWLKQRVPHTPLCKMNGGYYHTFVSGFNANENSFSANEGQHVRLGIRICGIPVWQQSGSRCLNARVPVKTLGKNNGGSAQCLFKKRG